MSLLSYLYVLNSLIGGELLQVVGQFLDPGAGTVQYLWKRAGNVVLNGRYRLVDARRSPTLGRGAGILG